MAPRYDAIVASVFVRAASASGRMDLAPPLQRLLQDLARQTAASGKPFVTTFFGNPYVRDVPAGPAGDAADLRFLRSRRGVGGARDCGRGADRRPLPIALPGMFEEGHGLARPGPATNSAAR